MADGVYMNERKVDVIMKKHLKNAMLKSNSKGFAPADCQENSTDKLLL
jgi:hypothetical protein